MVANLSDDDIWRLNRGGHDPHKVYAAYHAAVNTKGMPTVILAKTVKGYGMGAAGESQNPTHQQKKLDNEAVRAFRDRFRIPIADDKVDDVPYYHPGKDSPEVQYMLERRKALGGFLPQRRAKSASIAVPDLSAFEQITKGTGDREISTTMAFVRGMNLLLRDKQVAPRIVPIVADEARTFGMEGMFRQIGIYAPFGQKYKPVDADQLMYYREDQKGQVLQEGITEPGAMSAWIAAATSYSISDVAMLPFYIYYSMFGFQRVGDLAWAAGDMRARGFLVGGTAGRTTLNGEGLQHEDGHSHLMAGTIPNCRAYDPTFSYEIAVILQDGARRMLQEQEDVYYYITVMNENYAHPEMPKGAEADIIKGMYLLKDASSEKNGNGKGKGKNIPYVQLLGSGTILREVIAAAELLDKEFGVVSDIWSCPSFSELRRDGFDVERWNRLHPMDKTPRKAHVDRSASKSRPGPADRRDRLRARIRRPDPRVHAGRQALRRARHRRLRPQRHAREPARVLRSRPLLDRARGDRRAGRRRQDESRGCRAGDQAVEARSGQAESAHGLSCFFSPPLQGEGWVGMVLVRCLFFSSFRRRPESILLLASALTRKPTHVRVRYVRHPWRPVTFSCLPKRK